MKRILEMNGIRDIKTMRSLSARSMPNGQRSKYLELYTLTREKDRLEKDLFALDRRKNSIRKRLDNINNWMEKLRKEPAGGHKIRAVKNVSAEPVKILSLKY